MSANTGRAGSGRREAPRRTAGVPATASARSARPGRKTAVSLAGFGSAAALAGAGMAMLASPGFVPPVAGAAHTAQSGVQKATLTASKAATPPQPRLPGSNGTDASDVNTPADPPGNLLNPAPQTNNPSVGVQLNGTLPFSTIPGVLFGTPNGSATVKMDLPSMLFDNTAGGSGTFTVTSPQAGGFVNSFLGFLPIPQQQDLGSSVQNSRDSSGNLPSWLSVPLAGQSTAGANQNAADAFNAIFGPGGSADFAQNITEALLPQPVPLVNPFAPVNPDGSLNMVNNTNAAPLQPVPLVNPFAPVNPDGSLNMVNPVPTDGSGADFAARFSASSSDPSSTFNVNIPNNPVLGGSPAPAAPAAPANNTGDGSGNGGVVTTVPASSQVSGPDLSSMPATPVTLPAPATAGSSDLSNFGAQPSGTLYPSDASGGYGY